MGNNWIAFALLLLTVATLAGAASAGSPREADERATLVEGNTRFALDLYERLRTEDGNLFFSPLSLSTALAMTHAGARGQTAAEMSRALHFDLPPGRLHPTFAALLHVLDVKRDDPAYQLHLANALWAHEDYQFRGEFLAIGRDFYRAAIETLDFADNTEGARQRINAWVEEHTAGKISELIPRDVLGHTTRLVLTNAVYFKGDWAARFDAEATQKALFTLASGRQVETHLMRQEREFPYMERPTFQILELPYTGDALSMVVLLPRAADGLPALEKSLKAGQLAAWLRELRERKVQVALPRFRLTSQFRLDQVLRDMGMSTAFDPDRADFSGMDGTRNLYIGAVLHKTFVDVNEVGTEAAGATAVVAKLRVAIEPTPSFRADHPFLFLIRDTRSGSVLFLGRLSNPAE